MVAVPGMFHVYSESIHVCMIDGWTDQTKDERDQREILRQAGSASSTLQESQSYTDTAIVLHLHPSSSALACWSTSKEFQGVYRTTGYAIPRVFKGHTVLVVLVVDALLLVAMGSGGSAATTPRMARPGTPLSTAHSATAVVGW